MWRVEVDVLADGLEHEGLLAVAELLVAGLVGHRQRSRRLGKAAVRAGRGAVDADRVGLGVGVDVVGLGAFGHDDRDAAVRRDDVLHEEGGLGHHRSPAGLVPADRAVVEEHLQMAVIVHVGRDLVGEAQAHAAHLDRLGVGDLAHHVDDSGRRNRRCGEVVCISGLCVSQVAPEDCWLRFMRKT